MACEDGDKTVWTRRGRHPGSPAATSHVLAPQSTMQHQQPADVPGDDAVWRVGAYPDTRMSLTDTGAAAAYDESIPN